MSIRNQLIAFWITTALVLIPNTLAAFGYLLQAEPVMANFARIGLPSYLPILLGLWKLAGTAAIVSRRSPWATEWAYAGYTFVLSGAVFSHLAAGDPWGTALPPLIMLGLLIASYRLQPAKALS